MSETPRVTAAVEYPSLGIEGIESAFVKPSNKHSVIERSEVIERSSDLFSIPKCAFKLFDIQVVFNPGSFHSFCPDCASRRSRFEAIVFGSDPYPFQNRI